MNDRRYAKLSIIVILLAAVIRFGFALSHTVSGDACWHLSAAKFIAKENKIPLFEGIGRLQPFWAPPFFHITAALLYKIFAPLSSNLADLSLKFVSPIFGTLTVIILYLMTKRLFNGKIAFFSMIFINFVPLFLDYSIFSYTESAITFFSVLSVYFLVNNKYIFSAASSGLAILSKYNGIFMYPMLIYLTFSLRKHKRQVYKNLCIMVFLPLLISSFWFIRNLILLKNPFWPFLNGIFHGVTRGVSFNQLDFSAVLSIKSYWKIYLEFFGVPNGNIDSLSFYNSPLITYFFFIWILATVIFVYPLINTIFQKKAKDSDRGCFLKSIYLLFASYLLMLILYTSNTNWFGSRLLLPIVPFMGILWARGLDGIKLKKVYIVLALVISIGFIFVEGVKLNIASSHWGLYKQDFEWVKLNTGKSDVFYGNGQCLHYNIERLVISPEDKSEDADFNLADYIWVNNKWGVDYHMGPNLLSNIEINSRARLIYNNPATGTTIYKLKD